MLVVGLVIVAGCASEVIKWENAGTLVSLRSAEEPTRPPGRLGRALGQTEVGRTRVETTVGTYIVHGKVGVAQTGTPVRLGYDASDGSRDTPSHLAFGVRQYEIVR